MKKLLVFTDLDGTLLDHHDYTWEVAMPALNELKKKSYPLIINSSKTRAEIIRIRENIGNQHPFICENGSVINIPNGYFSNTESTTNNHSGFIPQYFGADFDKIIAILNKCRLDYNFKFTGFHDMTALEIGKLCGLNEEQSMNARQREASVPIVWHDAEKSLDHFKALMNDKGLVVIKGGRFYHVMGDVDKGETLAWLKEKYEAFEPATEWITIGLGDSNNDIRMLEVVDYPVLVTNNNIKQPDLTYLDNLITTEKEGPHGWSESMLNLIKSLQ